MKNRKLVYFMATLLLMLTLVLSAGAQSYIIDISIESISVVGLNDSSCVESNDVKFLKDDIDSFLEKTIVHLSDFDVIILSLPELNRLTAKEDNTSKSYNFR